MKNIKENIIREISNLDFEYANLSSATVLEYRNLDPSVKAIFLSPNVPLFCIVRTMDQGVIKRDMSYYTRNVCSCAIQDINSGGFPNLKQHKQRFSNLHVGKCRHFGISRRDYAPRFRYPPLSHKALHFHKAYLLVCCSRGAKLSHWSSVQCTHFSIIFDISHSYGNSKLVVGTTIFCNYFTIFVSNAVG